MDTRREFLKKATLLAGSAGLSSVLPESIQKAFAINPPAGTTYLDAEHIVILMQENRSFDHTYGTLQGVRGFNNPRIINLPNGNPVWLQTDAKGDTYAPFRLNIKDTKSTWMSSLPHSWADQTDARNGGRYDKWLHVKRSGRKDYAWMPLTLGYYTREDIPFYYALADAFTICDQNFCSSLTGTTPNRLYFWTGTIREKEDASVKANVRNEDLDYDRMVNWKTFPERLEENNISWKIYQNEINLPVGFTGEEDAWLANFSDNPLEWFTQYNVKFSKAYYQYIQKLPALLSGEIQSLEEKVKTLQTGTAESEKAIKQLKEKKALLEQVQNDLKEWTPEKYAQLSQKARNLHEKAFSTNQTDPDYHKLSVLKYQDGDTIREMAVPKGDVLYQFREDVKNKKLPTVSWIVAPENFSDHPSAPWYGAWYLSEVIDILTQNPEVWQKTIFILAYDENDGYFDHIPPFVPPHPEKPETGLASKAINASAEFVSMEQELKRKRPNPEKEGREGPIGLGFRVPLVIASPWSRGGWVNSEVFDHTSTLQFLEKFLSHKTGKNILESNISTWRRAVCGDLTSVFHPYNSEKTQLPTFVQKDTFIESIHKARFKKEPSDFKKVTLGENAQFDPSILPQQEKGIRSSCALPYELYADGNLNADKKSFEIIFKAGNEIFGSKSAGSPFQVYAPDKFAVYGKDGQKSFETATNRSYAVIAGDSLKDNWQLTDFEKENYHLRLYGPNGFYREFKGNAKDPGLVVQLDYESPKKGSLSGNVIVKLKNTDKSQSYKIEITDNAYKTGVKNIALDKDGTKNSQTAISINLNNSHNWYDLSIKVAGFDTFEKRYAGRVETGKDAQTDPLMGGVI
jgi:phospholipase C